MLIGIVALLLTDVAGLVIPWLLKDIIDLLPGRPASATLLLYAGLLFAAALVQAMARYGWRKYLFGPSRKVEFDLLNRLFSHLLTQDALYFQDRKTGDLMSRATNDLRAVRDFVGLGFLVCIDSTVVILCSVGLMLFIHPVLTLWVLVPLPFLSLLFFGFIREIGKRHEAVQAHLAKITARVQENLAGIRVLHAFVQEDNEQRRFDDLSREYIEKNLRVTRMYGVFTPSLVFTIGVAGLISLWLGSRAVIADEMTLGSFVAFNGYLMMLSWPMMGVGYVINLSQKGLVALGRIEEILAAKGRVADPAGAAGPRELGGAIEMRGVSFTYPGSGQPSLEAIDLSVEPGQTLAVVGRIGSGKSTLVRLLVRLFDAGRGDVLLDGIPIREIPLSVVRDQVVLVDQAPFLFSMSLRDNVALGRPEASREDIEHAVRAAGLEPDLARFPDGLDTVVGERGVSLSGGQKQRIALARALLRKPRILVLDDAFSSLDAATEETVRENLRRFAGGTTRVIVAHRLSAVEGTDRIVVLEHGRIVEAGTHGELVRRGGAYKRMVESQALAREWEITLL
jgi:ATP-binding cassette subfamily B protein